MTFLIILIVLALLLIWYALWGRSWLKSRPWAAGFFAWIEPIEIALFKKSETILIGRLLWVGGFLVTAYDGLAVFASSMDLTPLTTRIFDTLHVPPDMRGLTVTAFLAAVGLVMNRLRSRVSKPLELVALSDQAVAESPKLAEAVAMADATKIEAVAVATAKVEEAKAA